MTMPLLYTAELDLAEEDITPFLQWYAYRHAPDVYQVGIRTCSCYRVLDGDMNLFDLYELPDWRLFETERYRAMPGRDPYMAPLMQKRRNKAHTIYDQRLVLPASDEPCLDADWIAVARFFAPAEADESIIAALTAAFPALAAAGATRLRYATRGKDHPRNPTFRPRAMAVVEWPHAPPADVALMDLLAPLGGATELSGFTGHRVYPWVDRPAA
ncbi:MAG: hypothetical protein AB7O80_24960 [Acetobacteraceae bacterium]